MTPLLKNIKPIYRDRIPPQLVIQITNQCNAQCPQCGMRVTAKIPRSTLDIDTIKRTLDAAAAKGVQAVSFTGGEPLLHLDLLTELIRHAGKAGIEYIRTGTNGFLFKSSHRPGFEDRVKTLAEKLADTPLRNFWISLDSAIPSVHEQMRGLDGVVRGIEKALPIFHSNGLYPSVNLGINRLVGGDPTRLLGRHAYTSEDRYIHAFYAAFRRAFDQFYRQAANLGFTIVNTCYPMSMGDQEQDLGLSAVYAATAVDNVVRFSKREKSALYRALMDVIPHHRHRLRIFTPLSSLYMLARQYDTDQVRSSHMEVGCRGGIDFFFMDSENGHVFPCGYRGNENMGSFADIDLPRIDPRAECRKCDWECFRDPSELFAPFLDLFNRPGGLVRRFIQDPAYFSLWQNDIRYYRACTLFNGRSAPDPKRLSRFDLNRNIRQQKSYAASMLSLRSKAS
ncbi:MAG: radical SAM protein [Desulfobacteraceae bacterium]|nr:MAG: radical SAM protein [Desulfobacteraceae bacterium]